MRRSRDVSANHARAERGGGRPLRGQLLWLHTPPHDSRRVRRYRLRGHRRSRRGFPPACAPRSALEPLRRGNRHWGVGLRPGSRGRSFGLRRQPARLHHRAGTTPAVSSPRAIPHTPPRAPTPPRPAPARPFRPRTQPTARSRGPHSTLLFFSPPGSPPDSVSPNPPRSPASRRKSRRTSVSRARPRSRRPPSVTSSPPPTAAFDPSGVAEIPDAAFPASSARASLRIWRTISRQIPRRCGQSASPDAGPRAQPGVPPSATWATG